MGELEARFAGVARGRAVSVWFEPEGSLAAPGYQAVFNEKTSSFEVLLRRGLRFEGAYRCIERFIEGKAEQLDGIESVPTGHLDLRGEMKFWVIEKIYLQFRSDLEAAITERISRLERERPGEGVRGIMTVEARVRSLIGCLDYMGHADDQVRRAVLSPQTIRLLRSIGLDHLLKGG